MDVPLDLHVANLVLWARSENMGSATSKRSMLSRVILITGQTAVQGDPSTSVGMTINENCSSPMGLNQILALGARILYRRVPRMLADLHQSEWTPLGTYYARVSGTGRSRSARLRSSRPRGSRVWIRLSIHSTTRSRARSLRSGRAFFTISIAS